MIYEQFLFSQLLRDTIEEFNTLPYDELFSVSCKLYSENFIKSKYDKKWYWLYDCLLEYINNEKIYLVNEIKYLI